MIDQLIDYDFLDQLRTLFETIQMVVVAQILVRPFYNLANKREYEREIRIQFKKGTKNQRDLNKKKKN